MNTRRIATTITAAASVLALAACSPDGGTGSSWDEKGVTYEHQVQLEDGRTVSCVSWKSGYGGGIQCDWDNAR